MSDIQVFKLRDFLSDIYATKDAKKALLGELKKQVKEADARSEDEIFQQEVLFNMCMTINNGDEEYVFPTFCCEYLMDNDLFFSKMLIEVNDSQQAEKGKSMFDEEQIAVLQQMKFVQFEILSSTKSILRSVRNKYIHGFFAHVEQELSMKKSINGGIPNKIKFEVILNELYPTNDEKLDLMLELKRSLDSADKYPQDVPLQAQMLSNMCETINKDNTFDSSPAYFCPFLEDRNIVSSSLILLMNKYDDDNPLPKTEFDFLTKYKMFILNGSKERREFVTNKDLHDFHQYVQQELFTN